jgi:hypothetical protein
MQARFAQSRILQSPSLCSAAHSTEQIGIVDRVHADRDLACADQGSKRGSRRPKRNVYCNKYRPKQRVEPQQTKAPHQEFPTHARHITLWSWCDDDCCLLSPSRPRHRHRHRLIVSSRPRNLCKRRRDRGGLCAQTVALAHSPHERGESQA